jgi:outer membrane protein OmpA-like peptidoglycan-associated protein
MRAKSSFLVPVLILGTMSVMGCATKGYVRQQVEPVNTKVDQVSKQSTEQNKQTNARVDETNQKVQKNESDISANRETASTADSRSTQALNQAHQNSSQIVELHNTVANLEAYKMSDHTVVLFALNRHKLTDDAKAQLDKVAADVQGQQRYFITVEGYTDQTGAASYNDMLSRERAESVIRYLVGEHNVPLQRIHKIGLGEMHLVNNGKTRQDRKESRRVEVSVYVAPPLPAPKSNM